jgi:hypothetical protein
MEGLFIIPTMVSPNINPRLVPAFSKLIERNILTTGSATFRAAVLNKYSAIWKTVKSESVIEEDGKVPLNPGQVLGQTIAKKAGEEVIDLFKQTPSTIEKPRSIQQMTEPEKIEIPQGISFYHTIGLTPTILEIPMTIKKHLLGGGMAERIIRVGVKCIPYTIEGVENFVLMMQNIRAKQKIDQMVKGKLKSIGSKFKQFEMTGETMDIFNAPTSEELTNPKKLSKMMSSREPSTWSSLTIFSTEDFEGYDLRQTLLTYKKLVSAGWGDMVVYNTAKETVNFCTTRMNACYEIPLSYVKQILNLGNVLSYADVARWSKPFGVASLGKALSDNTEMNFKAADVEARILDIIRG